MTIYNEAQLSSYVDQIFKRLERLEDHARLVGEATGVPFSHPAADVPPDVVELARSGDRMGAIKRYRELTGAGIEAAQEVVAGL
jgi:hypothetical protein